MSRIAMNVPDMTCGRCVRTVRHALEQLPGVRTVEILLRQGRVDVDFDERRLDTGRLRAALEAARFPATILSEQG